jgi:hypothetical protein
MKIVIFGLAKSGTTALFYKIKNSLPPATVCLFEPRSFNPGMVKKRRSILRGKREPDVLAKVLPFRPNHPADVESFSHFEKQILIVRDPRDRLISRLLYGVYDSQIVHCEDKLGTVIEMLQLKETNPPSVSLKSLIEVFARVNGENFSFDEWANDHVRHSIRKPLDFHDARDNLFLFKYEDMIDGRFQKLEEYVGIPLEGEASVAPELSRVMRTKAYGGWRDWFTREDVDYFRPILQPFLDRYYPNADWELNHSASISSEHSSGYVLRIVNDRRAFLNKQPLVHR